ncbi:nuclear transport factor 2 family protein [Parapedobacter sp. 10938]|uniref:nuclear transport factor 2 family protein n=1 Tax=Parapedobacter flavus TaxID=3110225 RepID=UPI002DBCFE4D|nr:nuclear transport factor 2 family protein [Parapedobacter sp. 10938]MEC3880083.1 nuclear transport factor 2 family protein [Parapedobacter sp. 10938]
MVELEINADCKNSPRREFLKEFNSAFAKGDVSFIEANLDDEVSWHMVGDRTIMGKAAFITELESMKASPVQKMVLQTVVTHGRHASASGEMHLVSGEVYAYCDVYGFAKATGTTLKSITSYVIKI